MKRSTPANRWSAARTRFAAIFAWERRASSLPVCMARRRRRRWPRTSCASVGSSLRTTSAPRFRSSGRMRTGIRRVNTSWRRVMRATARSSLYHPEHAIVLNIEEEHLDYYENLDAIEVVFRQFLAQDDRPRFSIVRTMRTRRASARRIPAPFSYGEAREKSRYRFDDIHAKDFQSHFRVLRDEETLGAGDSQRARPAQCQQRRGGSSRLATELGGAVWQKSSRRSRLSAAARARRFRDQASERQVHGGG